MMVNKNPAYISYGIAFSIFISALFYFPAAGFSDVKNLDARLKQAETKLQQIENLQKTAQAEQDVILEKIKTLKVWAHRN